MGLEAQEDKKYTQEQLDRLYNALTDDQKRQIDELDWQMEDMFDDFCNRIVDDFCDRISKTCKTLILTLLSFFQEEGK